MASNSRRTSDTTENKEKNLNFSLDQISQQLAAMTSALGFIYSNQDVFNKLTEEYDKLKMEELALLIKKGLEKENEELSTDINFVQSCIAELNSLVELYQHISPILKMYQPDEPKIERGYHARGSSQTN